jgi:hypothetical protein
VVPVNGGSLEVWEDSFGVSRHPFFSSRHSESMKEVPQRRSSRAPKKSSV